MNLFNVSIIINLLKARQHILLLYRGLKPLEMTETSLFTGLTKSKLLFRTWLTPLPGAYAC